MLWIVTNRGRNIVKGVEDHMPFINTNYILHIIQRVVAAGLKAALMETTLKRCH